MVDPLGEVLMKLLPEGLKVLFAPGAEEKDVVDALGHHRTS
jgi:hypothetical protein